MNEPTTAIEPVVREVVVAAPIETCFRTFVDGFATWWPPEHHIGEDRTVDRVRHRAVRRRPLLRRRHRRRRVPVGDRPGPRAADALRPRVAHPGRLDDRSRPEPPERGRRDLHRRRCDQDRGAPRAPPPRAPRRRAAPACGRAWPARAAGRCWLGRFARRGRGPTGPPAPGCPLSSPLVDLGAAAGAPARAGPRVGCYGHVVAGVEGVVGGPGSWGRASCTGSTGLPFKQPPDRTRRVRAQPDPARASRRGFLTKVAAVGGGAAATAAVLPLDSAGAAVSCAPNVLCGSICVNTSKDQDNCGACGHVCAPGELCSLGKCCPCGTVNCGGVCTDVWHDPANCGKCGKHCRHGQVCKSGKCVTQYTSGCSVATTAAPPPTARPSPAVRACAARPSRPRVSWWRVRPRATARSTCATAPATSSCRSTTATRRPAPPARRASAPVARPGSHLLLPAPPAPGAPATARGYASRTGECSTASDCGTTTECVHLHLHPGVCGIGPGGRRHGRDRPDAAVTATRTACATEPATSSRRSTTTSAGNTCVAGSVWIGVCVAGTPISHPARPGHAVHDRVYRDVDGHVRR